MAFIYDTTVDPEAEQNSHAFTLDLVGYNKRVLEVGCATGYFTKALVDRGCSVVGIELDPEAATIAEEWAERVVVGDLDAGELWYELKDETFDAITFGDVLEHLRDPLTTLRAAARHLKPSGIVVISVPNIAHGDVRMSLLQGTFSYNQTGLLDRTHVHFFTKSSLEDTVKEAGLVPVELRRVLMPLFQTELGIERAGVSQSTINQVLEDPEAESYQFVLKAVLDNGTLTLSKLADRVIELTGQAHHEVVRTALLRKELYEVDRLRAKAATMAQELEQRRLATERARAELQLSQAELEECRRQVERATQLYEAVLRTKSYRLLSPLRRIYGRLRRRSGPRSGATTPQ